MSKKLSKPIFLILAFVSGTILGLFIGLDEKIIFSILVVCLVLIAFKQFRILALLLALFIGFGYVQMFVARSNANVNPGCFEGKVASIPKETKNGTLAKFQGRGTAFAILTNEEELNPGEHLKVCFDSSAIKVETGGYGNYILSQFQTKSVVKNPSITIVDSNKKLSLLFDLRNLIGSVLKRIYVGDKGALAQGLILGGSEGLSDQFKQAMKDSGTTHLVAVSGYNVSIITIVIFSAMRSLVSRRFALTSSVAILAVFCLITGGSSSVVRASIMGGMYLMSKALGRKVPPLHLLSMAAFVMVLLNPFVVYDAGFQLSFAATAGLLLSIDIFSYLQKPSLSNVLFLTIAQTLVAQIFTFPILIYQFHQVSMIAAIPNALLLPIVPLAMFAIFIAALSGAINLYFGILIGFLGEVILRYFIFVINFFANVPFAKAQIGSFPVWALVGAYVLILSAIIMVSRKINEKKPLQSI